MARARARTSADGRPGPPAVRNMLANLLVHGSDMSPLDRLNKCRTGQDQSRLLVGFGKFLELLSVLSLRAA